MKASTLYVIIAILTFYITWQTYRMNKKEFEFKYKNS